jgi:hypothetical protein
MDGENLHAQQRKQFWRNLALAGIGAAPIGAGVGWGIGRSKGDFNAFWNASPDWLILSLLALAAATIIYGSWRFYRAIDEVELLDNLWASSAAYSAYALLFPAWWVLGKSGITGAPNHWLVFVVALGAGLAVYLARKWRAR